MPRLAALLGLSLTVAALAAPYSWTDRPAIAPSSLAPTDQRTSGRPPTIVGAALQGGLVDLRYGQVSIDLGGQAEVLDLDERSILTLDGVPITVEELSKRVAEGLTANLRYNPASGRIGWLDAYSDGADSKAVHLQVVPWHGPAYTAGEVLTLSLTPQEVARLGLSEQTLVLIPGQTHDLRLSPTLKGGLKAYLRVLPGWDFRTTPIFLRSGPTATSALRAGPQINISTSAPTIIGHGPQAASSKLGSIPGWVDHRSAAHMLDPSTAKLVISEGARITQFQPRVDRTSFQIETDGPGTYWLQFSIADQLGRTVRMHWPLIVQPG